MAAKTVKIGAFGSGPARTELASGPWAVGKAAIGWLLSLVLVLGGSTSALACPGGFLQAVLFHKYPEAKSTTAAIQEARERGVLKGVQWSKNSGQSIHAWRTERTRLTVKALQKQLNSTWNPSTPRVGTSVFLLNEFVWLRIEHDGERIAVVTHPYGAPMSEPKVFTTRRVLDELMRGGISRQQVIDEGLMTPRCGADCSSDKPFELLTLAMPALQAQAHVLIE